MSETSKKKYPENKPSKHATVRIPKGLMEAVKTFLETDLAKRMGYCHRVDVVTDGTRQLLEKCDFYKSPDKK